MIERIAVILTVTNEDGVQLLDMESNRPIPVQPVSLLLTLEKETGATFARGHIQDLSRPTTYPFQSSAGLFDRLQEFLAKQGLDSVR